MDPHNTTVVVECHIHISNVHVLVILDAVSGSSSLSFGFVLKLFSHGSGMLKLLLESELLCIKQ